MDSIEKAVSLIKKSNYTIAFTGAGISTESGIPDFRSSGGLWEEVDPQLFTAQNFIENPIEFYELALPLFKEIKEAEPNPAHFALAELEAAGDIEAVITQNIDNLHQQAGSESVLEIHGHLRTGSCQGCAKEYSFAEIEELMQKDGPYCLDCQGLIKLDIVFFGDSLTTEFMEARKLASQAELLIVIGSSLEVSPANLLPQLADKSLIINLSTTPFDSQAEVVINDSASRVLAEIAELA
ncbi:SIR2 family NAD-dependent protein deacylase [Fuchsiella alkaliacetigena]|uniref:SIR2 family NAD-dependent protein deacylase n=1 Tax=Fuchsiella alkaliacetigena TaxID=957042 RepID=UPI00200A16CF|nr:Sir2 family NAD-dependent protein deacetylase [Fuchsiella alkaliacetigena]MCK8824960.1 RNA polymerase subunit sigma [Fuchsiella alkaliacetigena]